MAVDDEASFEQPDLEAPRPEETGGDVERLARLAAAWQAVRRELSQVIVGQDAVLEQLFIAMLSSGHALLVGVPGLAKTLMVRTLAQTLDLSFARIQFTPDLMPADITGTEVIQEDRSTGRRSFQFMPGPVFANVLLADEINRTPPKTQAALLEAMQERQVTAGGQRHTLPDPFFVLATQNPIEQEGTYALPEAQLDRFLLQIRVEYPDVDEEFEILRQTTRPQSATISRVVSAEDWHEFQTLARRIPVADYVLAYAMRLCRATRPQDPSAPEFIRKYVHWGAGPRAGQALVLAAKARAAIHGQPFAGIADVQALAPAVLRHRLLLRYTAEADQKSTDDLVADLLQAISTEVDEGASRKQLPHLFKK
jgi:MoxR-like ATPase